ncbi:flagellar hook assembly protein FlgD [Cellulomonas hominis]
MSIDMSYITDPTTRTSTTGDSKAASNELDKQAFLELLVAQLRNQDPSSPMDTSQMMAQTTQLATMESLQEVATTSREAFALQMRMSAADLVGKQITYADAEGVTQTGVVTSVSYAKSVPVVKIGATEVALDAVASVAAPGTPVDPPDDPADPDTPTD